MPRPPNPEVCVIASSRSDHGHRGRLLLISVGVLSGVGLAFEVLVMRLLSIVGWHHFANMVISLALLGFAASGTFLAVLRRRLEQRFTAAFLTNAALFGVALLASFVIAQRLPFNPQELIWRPRQTLVLAGLYLLLAAPFFCVANAIGLALQRFSGDIHRIYRADLLGAGLGAVSVIGLLFVLPPTVCLRLLAGLAMLGAGAAAADPLLGGRRRTASALVALGLLLPVVVPSSWVELRLSPYKELSRALDVPGAEVVATESGPMGLLSVVQNPRIPFRHAPGLSLAFPGRIPEQLGLFTDGGSLSVINRWESGTDPPSYLRYLTSAAPYRVLERPSVLVVGAGGGTEVLSALAHGAARVDAVEVNPQTAELMTDRFLEFSGDLYARRSVDLHVAEGRSFLAARGDRRWDLIQVALVDSFASASTGVHAASSSSLYTVEAMVEMLRRLEPGGILALSSWVEVPPRANLKLFATAVEALLQMGEERPERRLVWLRTWNTATLLIGASPFSAADVEALAGFADELSFDLAWFAGMEEGRANRYNVLDRPFFFHGARALLGPERESFLRRYKFHVTPATDQKPFFSRFFRWRTLPELLELRGRGGTPLIQWSYLVTVATAVQATVFGALIILLPLALVRWRGRRGTEEGRTASAGGDGGGLVTMASFFVTVGLGFLFIEISMIHHLTLLLGHPLFSVSAVLGSFLVFAGLGSGSAEEIRNRIVRSKLLPATARRHAVALPAAGAALLAALYLPFLPWVVAHGLGLPVPIRLLVAVALVAPLAFLMGMPFPLGLARTAKERPDLIPWAWGINGWASVISAVLATLLAMHLGFAAVLGLSAGLYGLAGMLLARL